MSAERLREQGARLLALALRAREGGRTAYADELVLRASEYLDRAREAEAIMSPPPQTKPATQHVAQQQQQPPLEPEKE